MSNKILLDNAIASWISAIKYCNNILNGQVDFLTRKSFVNSLHNSIELFLKQIMIDNLDYRIGHFKKSNEKGIPAKEYYNSNNLNDFLKSNHKDFISVSFGELTYNYLDNIIKISCPANISNINIEMIRKGMKKLIYLRNDETHFYVNINTFLNDQEFLALYDLLIEFSKFLQKNKYLGFFGKPIFEHRNCFIENIKIPRQSFSYKELIKNSNYYVKLKKILHNKSFDNCSNLNTYCLCQDIFFIINSNKVFNLNDFEKFYNEIKLLKKYKLIEIIENKSIQQIKIHSSITFRFL
jgi:hypothetical protein